MLWKSKLIKKRQPKDRNLQIDRAILANIINILTDPVIMINSEFRIMWLNRAARKMFGANVIGSRYHDVFYKCDTCYGECILKKCFRDGKNHDLEIQVTIPDGKTVDMWCTAIAATRYPDGKPQSVMKICRDITAMKNCQSEAMKNAHFTSLGELTGGIAHEINNPVTGIINYAQILIDQYQEEGRDAEIPKRIMHEGERIAGIVKRLMAFVGERNKEKIPLQIKSVLIDTLGLTRTLMKKDNIRIQINFIDDIPVVVADSQELQQVFLNLLSNARCALNQKYPNADSDKIIEIIGRIDHTKQGGNIQIIFKDHGTGIPSEIFYKIQAPFFTQNPTGHHMGLGLVISHSLIKNNGGRLRFESEKGVFTKAVVEFPLEENTRGLSG